MSEYTRVIARPVRVTLAQNVLASSVTAAKVRRTFPELDRMPVSSVLGALAAELNAADATAGATRSATVARRILADPSVVAVTTAIGGVDCSTIAAEVASGNTKRLSTLASGIEAAATAVAADDRRVVAAAYSSVLRERGFQVTVEDRAGSSRVVATLRSEGQAVVVEAHDSGVVERDVKGCEAGSCRVLLRGVDDDLRKRGIAIHTLDVDRHDDPGGGALVARVGPDLIAPSSTRRTPTRAPRPTSSRQVQQ